MKNWLTYWLPVLAYAGLITYLSSLSDIDTTFPDGLLQINDKVLHALEYSVLGALCYRAFRNAAGSVGTRHAIVLAIVSATGFGLIDEIHQSFVPLRQTDGLDLLADAIGATIGALSWHRIH